MTKVLVPVDGSSLAEAALPVAVEIARADGGSIVLATVGELPEVSVHRQEEEAALNKILDRAAGLVEGVSAERRLDLGGDPVQGILDIAREEAVDRIVMTTHGRSGLSRLTHGSVAASVLERSEVPVTLVHPERGELRGRD